MSNIIGRLGVYIFIFSERGRKVLKINNCSVTQAMNLVANGNQHNKQVHKN